MNTNNSALSGASLSKNWFLTVGILDIELDPETESFHIDHSQLGFYVSLGTKLQDVLMLSSESTLQPQSQVRIPLSALSAYDSIQPTEKLVISVRSVSHPDIRVGSVSIPQHLFLSCGETRFKQWITLFDHADDDEYDGDFVENDEESPRVQFLFSVDQDVNAPLQQQTRVSHSQQVQSVRTSQLQQSANSKKSPTRLDEARGSYSSANKQTINNTTTASKQNNMNNSTTAASVKKNNTSQTRLHTTTTQQQQQTTPGKKQQATPNRGASAGQQPITVNNTQEPDILSMMGDPQRRFKVDFLQTLLDDKLATLVTSLKAQQKDNFTQESDTLSSLNVLQGVNADVQRVLEGQRDGLERLREAMEGKEQEHRDVIEGDQEAHGARERLEELEQALAQLKADVEDAAIENQNIHLHRVIGQASNEHVIDSLVSQQITQRQQLVQKLRETLEQISTRLDITVHLHDYSNSNAAPGSTIDFAEAEALCELIQRKDRDMLLKMMRSRDDAKKDWLRNFLHGELHQMLASDKYDLQSHLKSQSADLEKLSKVVSLLTQNNVQMSQRQAVAEDDLNRLEDEAQGIMDERQVYDEAFSKFDGETQALKDQISAKRDVIAKKDQILDTLGEDVAMRDAEIERLSSILNEKDMELAEIEDRMRTALGPSAPNEHISKIYSAIKGDAVDEYLAKYINLMQCPVPIQRLGNGYYLFGTRKIFAKIMNGKLVIRVGGGYMVIEEFIATYADQEVNRCKLLQAQQQLADEGGRRGSMLQKKTSPRGSMAFGGSPKGGFAKITLPK
ncbi:hypothetical protein FGO68_gene11806 [Halteria grandinella]|uniref:GAR domain-containing protein n=1 Tax=Halteria grandinella TaxID=5974 RepID=A0A8J8T7D3_HALGN|nr:hypothetical protein FGO68_gene11806 [Halteria grandinella]